MKSKESANWKCKFEPGRRVPLWRMVAVLQPPMTRLYVNRRHFRFGYKRLFAEQCPHFLTHSFILFYLLFFYAWFGVSKKCGSISFYFECNKGEGWNFKIFGLVTDPSTLFDLSRFPLVIPSLDFKYSNFREKQINVFLQQKT